jgi:hypothetical protein
VRHYFKNRYASDTCARALILIIEPRFDHAARVARIRAEAAREFFKFLCPAFKQVVQGSGRSRRATPKGTKPRKAYGASFSRRWWRRK